MIHLCQACGDGEPGQRLEAAGFTKVPIEGVTYLPAQSMAELAAIVSYGDTYEIEEEDGREVMFCRLCSHTTRGPQDVKNRFCPRCNRYHTPPHMSDAEAQRFARLNMVPARAERERPRNDSGEMRL